MQLPQSDYYAIQDISDSSGAKKSLTVVSEWTTRAEAEFDAYKRSLCNCEVYYELEQDGKRYRVICPKTTMLSDAKDAR
jgi:hypothetical protein